MAYHIFLEVLFNQITTFAKSNHLTPFNYIQNTSILYYIILYYIILYYIILV
jgi:hypothetical protein